MRSGTWLPGTNTIPEQISKEKVPYYKALEAADDAWQQGALDLQSMEALLGKMLATQLVDFHKSVTA